MWIPTSGQVRMSVRRPRRRSARRQYRHLVKTADDRHRRFSPRLRGMGVLLSKRRHGNHAQSREHDSSARKAIAEPSRRVSHLQFSLSGAPTNAYPLLPERTLRCRSEVNLLGRQILNILSNDPQLAVGQLDEFRGSSVRRTTNLGWTEPGADGLSHTRLEILPRGAVPFQSVGGDHFQVPGHLRAAGFHSLHVKIRVRILPIESRQQPSEIRARIFVELHGESVVRKPRSRCDNQTKSRNQNATKLASHRDVPPVNGFANTVVPYQKSNCTFSLTKRASRTSSAPQQEHRRAKRARTHSSRVDASLAS